MSHVKTKINSIAFNFIFTLGSRTIYLNNFVPAEILKWYNSSITLHRQPIRPEQVRFKFSVGGHNFHWGFTVTKYYFHLVLFSQY